MISCGWPNVSRGPVNIFVREIVEGWKAAFIICSASIAVIEIFVSYVFVGAPTPDASPRIRGHHPSELSAGRSRSADQLSLANDGTSSRRRIRSTENQEPLRFHARASFARKNMVLRTAFAGTGAHQPVRTDRIISRRFPRLPVGNCAR